MSSKTSLLLIDDNPNVAAALSIALRVAGYDLAIAHNPEEAISHLSQQHYGAILLDLNFSQGASDGKEGLSLLRKIIRDDPAACVLILTAHGGVRIAVTAMQEGARDFIIKPWRNDDVIQKIEAAMKRTSSHQSAHSATTPQAVPKTAAIIGESAAIEEVRELIRRIGPTPANAAISGPRGSGKMLAARAILALSSPEDGPVTLIDLREGIEPAISLASQGAAILKYPDHLDEIAQDRLATLLPSHMRTISIVGDISSLSPSLRRRLATAHLRIPPLAARGDDAVLLARHFARLAAEQFGRDAAHFTPSAEEHLRKAHWEDEVRGLALAVERAVLLADGGLIDTALLIPADEIGANIPAPSQSVHGLHDAEKAIVTAALHKHNSNVTKAAAALGISRGALYRRMERYGL